MGREMMYEMDEESKENKNYGMNIPYMRIDFNFFSDLDSESKSLILEHIKKRAKDEINIEEFLEKSERRFYFQFCPYCGEVGILSVGVIRGKKMDPLCCVTCGESNPYHKIKQSLEKSKIFQQLAVLDIHDANTKRVLLEQSIVILATGIEVFLRDIYAITLNLRYVKEYKSLYSRFHRESRNDFINIGKTHKKYLDDLEIDLKKILSKKTVHELNLLMLKRNTIVHNIGIVDKTFIEQSGMKCKLKRPVPIYAEEIGHYISIIDEAIKKIEELFINEFKNEMLQKVKTFLKD